MKHKTMKKFKVFYKDAKTGDEKIEIVTDAELQSILNEHNVESWKEVQDLSMLSFEELILHSVLLLRTVNRYQTKEKQIAEYTKWFADKKDELIDYIYHFDDPQPETDWEELCAEEAKLERQDREYYTSCTAGDYSPSCPWNAPGMSIKDFI